MCSTARKEQPRGCARTNTAKMARLDGLFHAHVSTGCCACVGCKLGRYEVVFVLLVAIGVIPFSGHVERMSHIVTKGRFTFMRRGRGARGDMLCHDPTLLRIVALDPSNNTQQDTITLMLVRDLILLASGG